MKVLSSIRSNYLCLLPTGIAPECTETSGCKLGLIQFIAKTRVIGVNNLVPWMPI